MNTFPTRTCSSRTGTHRKKHRRLGWMAVPLAQPQSLKVTPHIVPNHRTPAHTLVLTYPLFWLRPSPETLPLNHLYHHPRPTLTSRHSGPHAWRGHARGTHARGRHARGTHARGSPGWPHHGRRLHLGPRHHHAGGGATYTTGGTCQTLRGLQVRGFDRRNMMGGGAVGGGGEGRCELHNASAGAGSVDAGVDGGWDWIAREARLKRPGKVSRGLRG